MIQVGCKINFVLLLEEKVTREYRKKNRNKQGAADPLQRVPGPKGTSNIQKFLRD
jgi:hypothetical protein